MQLAIYFHLKDHKFSPTSYIVEGRGDFCVKIAKFPRVTHGKELCKPYQQLLMGRIYAKHTTNYSW